MSFLGLQEPAVKGSAVSGLVQNAAFLMPLKQHTLSPNILRKPPFLRSSSVSSVSLKWAPISHPYRLLPALMPCLTILQILQASTSTATFQTPASF